MESGLLGRLTMKKILSLIGALCVALCLTAGSAKAQTPSPEAMAAAKELIATMKIDEQFKVLMPSIITALKPAIVQGRADVARDYDALAPQLVEAFQSRLSEISDTIATIYAKTFSADDLRALAAFYRSPVGEKFVEKNPELTQQTLAVGQQFGRSIGADLRQRMIDELKKKGHSI
jgi:uncharacterized protein